MAQIPVPFRAVISASVWRFQAAWLAASAIGSFACARSKPAEPEPTLAGALVVASPSPSPSPSPAPLSDVASKNKDAAAVPAATATTSPPKGMPAAAATPTPMPTPIAPSPFLGATAFTPNEGNKTPTTLLEQTRTEIAEASRDEQFALLAPQTSAVQGDLLFFQRRYTPSDRFAAFSQRTNETQSGEIIRNMPQIFDALVYCPISNEIVFQAPPISNSDGKFNLKARPTRVYLFSLATGKTELIWRRDKDREGTFVPRMSATPDCRHVLLNLALESPGNKIPYGELIYLRRPSQTNAGSKASTALLEWSSSTINETAKNSVWRGFGEALFVQPSSPESYVTSDIPPPVFAVTEMVDKERNAPLVNVFMPSGGARVLQASGIRWARERVPSDRDVRSLSSPAVYNGNDAVFLVMESNEFDASGFRKSAIVAFRSRALDQGMKRVVLSGGQSFRSLDVHPSGTRIAASYTAARTEEQVEALSDRAIAGMAEFTLSPGDTTLKWANVHTMLPFHALEKHHDPRPVYAADGRSLYFVSANVLELPEAAQFGAGAKVNHDLQFGSKLMRIDVPAGK